MHVRDGSHGLFCCKGLRPIVRCLNQLGCIMQLAVSPVQVLRLENHLKQSVVGQHYYDAAILLSQQCLEVVKNNM